MQSEVKAAADLIVAEIRARMAQGKIPFLVAIDGGSGRGKSTLGLMIAQEWAAFVQSDDFYDARFRCAWDARDGSAKGQV